ASQIEAFFGIGDPSAWRYRRMVLHYADLAAEAGGVDGFVIGSELRGLTRVRSAPGVYPAVDALAELAADVKAILGDGTVVTYGADWTEYGSHVVSASEVRFPLDALWASPAIDAVGIDYYAPLSDWREGADHLDRALASDIHERAYLAANLSGGEAYDWFYPDDTARAAQARSPITDGLGKPWVFRAKDFWNWWANAHYERVGGVELTTPTAWTPQGKPIWLTEVGCPAVDKGSNQPSIFPDAKSADAGVPYFSNGGRDDLIQRRFLEAVLTTFDPAHGATSASNPLSSVYGTRMVDPSAIQVWTWDARPYPFFPAALDVWSDGVNWETGHWLTGRLGASPLSGLIAAILADAGITDADSTALGEGPDGYVIDRPMSPRAAVEPLARAFAFDATADDLVRFRPRGGEPVLELDEDDLVLPEQGAPVRLVRAQETELSREVALGFTDGFSDYRRSAAASRRLVGGAAHAARIDLAAVMDLSEAERRAEIWLQDLWAGRETAEFALPPSRLALMPGDVIALIANGRRRLFELREIVDTESRRVSVRSIDPEVFGLALAPPRRRPPSLPSAAGPVHALVLDLPTIEASEPTVLLYAAVSADPWPGPVAIWRSFDGTSYERAGLALAPAIVGETLDDLAPGPVGRWDRGSTVRVALYGGALASVSDAALFGGANAAALRRPDGAWEILQFTRADLVGDRTYALSRLLRGQAGSEWAMDNVPAGAPFVVLDRHVVALARGLDALGRTLKLRFVAADRSHGDPIAVALEATPQATALRPLAPVHLSARRTGAGVVVSWIRRTRRDGDGWEAEVPLGEEREAYETDILSGSNVVRTLASSEPAVLYAAADELADFGAPQASLTVRVAQLSATVGRGFARTATLAL
ncbi:MAG TPA: glycoside hydrolase/phage tail family protein, partial [Xanthobacteraceae bacterium]